MYEKCSIKKILANDISSKMYSVSSLQHNTELDFNNYKITKLYLSESVFPDL